MFQRFKDVPSRTSRFGHVAELRCFTCSRVRQWCFQSRASRGYSCGGTNLPRYIVQAELSECTPAKLKHLTVDPAWYSSDKGWHMLAHSLVKRPGVLRRSVQLLVLPFNRLRKSARLGCDLKMHVYREVWSELVQRQILKAVARGCRYFFRSY